MSPLAVVDAAKKTDDPASEKAGNEKRNTTVLELTADLAKVHDAAVLALSKIGCEIKKDEAVYVEGKRPNKIGLAVGSGGEKLFVWIKDLGDGRVELTVKTKKTTVGIVGQKLWNEEVAEDIRASVS